MIKVHNRSGPGSQDVLGLLDTGADYLTLDNKTSRWLNLDLKKCRKIPLVSATGHRNLYPYTDVDITIFNKRATVMAILGVPGMPLIGRDTIWKFIDFGIDIDGWLYREI